METLNQGYIFFAVLVILAILFVVSIIKKAFKLIVFLIVIVLGFSAYNIVVKGVSPIEEINSYKTDIVYAKDIKDYSSKIKTSVDNIKKVVEEKKVNEQALNSIKVENANLHKYESEVIILKHTSRLEGFHKNYCGYLKTIVEASDSSTKISGSLDNKNISKIEETVKKLNDGLLQINNLKK